MFYDRIIEKYIRSVSDTFPVMILTGPRQVGKTTLLTRIAEPRRSYVGLDNPTNRALAKSDPELFLQRFKPPVIIDEIQYASELLDYVKIHADRYILTQERGFIQKANSYCHLGGNLGYHRHKHGTH